MTSPSLTLRAVLAAGALLAGLHPSMSDAGSLRCDNELVTRGDSAFDVIETCGQPDWKNTRYEEIHYGKPHSAYRNTRLITIDEWIYRGRSGRFDRRLVFFDGRLHRIHLGERR